MTGGPALRILLIHNSYRQAGGEDRVVSTEAQVLRTQGHDVFTYSRTTPPNGGWAVLRLAGQVFWNQRAYEEIRALIRSVRPEVVHVHNTFPFISPVAYYAARREGVPTVQTLHNYRVICPNGLLFRDGRPCHDCLHTTLPWPAFVHACYRDSHAASLVAGSMTTVHRAAGTWSEQVDRYIAPTEFARQRFIAGGLPAARVVVKPHVVHPDPGPGPGDGGYALFAGRLSREKGVETLLATWSRVGHRMPLTIAGDGPLAPAVRRHVAENRSVTWLGHRSQSELEPLLGGATCVVVPSLCYETFGLVIAEAFARGTPVIAARLGAVAELVEHERTGLHFTPGDADDLARQVTWLADRPTTARAMRGAARDEYERRYSMKANYPILFGVYADAISRRRAAPATESMVRSPRS